MNEKELSPNKTISRVISNISTTKWQISFPYITSFELGVSFVKFYQNESFSIHSWTILEKINLRLLFTHLQNFLLHIMNYRKFSQHARRLWFLNNYCPGNIRKKNTPQSYLPKKIFLNRYKHPSRVNRIKNVPQNGCHHVIRKQECVYPYIRLYAIANI